MSIIIIPFKVSPLDIIHAQATIDLIKKIQHKKNNLNCRLVINQLISNTSLISNLRHEIEDLKVPLLITTIQNRTSFIRSIIEEKGIFSTNDKKAIKQIENFTSEIIKILQ